ncbi:GNAT family N-acetyltransferase [Paenibacillus eucommiae]|uniref:GNAT superfamily N-acetyltransferase n=1 Tax=Paenibacillus eucommiae TaxID=1355755 RepID=A0ABS4J0B7_9BACL|nr:GNAT family N-acetyltransferase [Paenibacillus eucommiae]MBP1993253.1 GNAT superfamily N-acetyltransferase [Paenibacillus eucommiae]
MSYIVREYEECDLDQVSSISRSVYDNKAGSFSIVSNLQDKRMLRKYVVAGEDGQIIGCGLLWEQSTKPYLILKVEILFSDNENLMGADNLYTYIENDIKIINPNVLQARMFDDQEHLLELYRNKGFAKNHSMMHDYLNVTDYEPTPNAELENRLRLRNIFLTTLSKEQVSDINYFQKLQMLNTNTWADYPTDPLLPPSSPSDYWLSHEDNIPDAYFIAKIGQLYIGYSHLMKMIFNSNDLIQGLTASLREFRGIGIATALKIKGIEYAKRNGYNGIFTSYRNTNISMGKVNRKLGWRPNYCEVRLEKILHIN